MAMNPQKRPDLQKQLQDTQTRLGKLERSSRLNSASIGSGGLTVRDGGALTLESGHIQVEGGSVVIHPGGSFYSLYDDGGTAAYFGPLSGLFDQGFVLMGKENDRARIWLTRMNDGTYRAVLGAGTDPQNMGLHIIQMGAASLYAEAKDVWLGDVTTPGRGLFMQNGWTWLAEHQVFPGGSANCFIDTSGAIYRVTSSERYKTDIQPAAFDTDSILALEPKTFKNKAEVAAGSSARPLAPTPPGAEEPPAPEPVEPKTYVGFIAEEADALGLKDFVEYDADGLPEGFAYSSFVVAQQAVIREQAARIDALESRLATIEALLKR